MKKISVVCLLVFALGFSCKEKYVPQLNLTASSYLVVEGFINSGVGATTITLSRTTKLSDTTTIKLEPKATVKVEGKLNTTGFVLTETSPGKYTNPQLTLNPADQYRVYIKTSAGREYVSAYSAVRTTPVIDSVFWRRENEGVQLYVNTHDATNKTRYYQYFYDETWEFHAQYMAVLKVLYNSQGIPRGIGYIDSTTYSLDTNMYRCWQYSTLSNILITSTEQLTQDVVALRPLQFIEKGSWKLSQLYTILVKQRAVSKEGYQFLEQLRKNTEQIGSIFDAQPSDNNGNIRCLNNPAEPVMGFVEVTQEKEQRIWINVSQVPGWYWDQGCDPEIQIKNNPDSLLSVGPTKYMLTTIYAGSIGGFVAYANAALYTCVDCRTKGVRRRPPYWP